MGTETGVSTASRHTNVLRTELRWAARATGRAAPEDVYDLLADLRSHLVWGGEHQGRTTRLLSMEAPEGPARVGTEFRSAGTDPMGRFEDTSVVTRAERPRLFEFVTEARLVTAGGRTVEWTLVHRYEITPSPQAGCQVHYQGRIVRISELPGMLRLLGIPGIRTLALKASGGLAARGLRNLVRLAEERAGAGV
jgi:uncharacterized protein YndB with AHSA1/START domain